jgi:hypothetical protein
MYLTTSKNSDLVSSIVPLQRAGEIKFDAICEFGICMFVLYSRNLVLFSSCCGFMMWFKISFFSVSVPVVSTVESIVAMKEKYRREREKGNRL